MYERPALYLLMLTATWLVGGWGMFFYADHRHKWRAERLRAKAVDGIAAKLPDERAAVEKLARLLRQPGDTFSAEVLHGYAGTSSRLALARILFEMSVAGLIESFVMVEPPSGERLGPYATICDVPNEASDERAGGRYHVQPEDIRIYWHGPRRTEA